MPDHCAKGIDTHSPENLIIFAIGLAADVKPMPLAGDWINRGGYDAIIIKGEVEHLTLLEATHETVSLHDAGDLWGTRYYSDQKRRSGIDFKGEVVAIGPASERLNASSVINNNC